MTKNRLLLDDLLEKSYLMAKRLLPFMAQRRIPLTPVNYRLFYDYFQGDNPRLISTLDEALSTFDGFEPELSNKIYMSFYHHDGVTEVPSEFLTETVTSMENVTGMLEASLDTAMGQANSYRQILSDKTREIADAAAADDLQWIIKDLLTETQTAITSQSTLTRQLEESNQIIASLSVKLKDQTRLATIDELTQLYNRRYLNVKFESYVNKAQEDGKPCSLMMLDLDHFKNINDTWGHLCGDKVLALCAAVVKKAATVYDLPVRYGGEEFLLLCPGTGLKEAYVRAEKIRQTIAETQITVRGDVLPVTISVGVAEYRSGESTDDFVTRADRALYEAKESGRNQVRRETPRNNPFKW